MLQIPPASAPREEVIAAAVANCEAQMAEDRKTTALKALQVAFGKCLGWEGARRGLGGCAFGCEGCLFPGGCMRARRAACLPWEGRRT